MSVRYAMNKELEALPPPSSGAFVYREARWVDLLWRCTLFGTGLGLAYLVSVRADEFGSVLAGLGGLAALLLLALAFVPAPPEHATLFVADANGIYLPQSRRRRGNSPTWLFVPWSNVLDYRVELLMDETSRQGLVVALVIDEAHERAYIPRHRRLPLRGRFQEMPARAIEVGYASYYPHPRDVLLALRALDNGRAEDAPQPLATSG